MAQHYPTAINQKHTDILNGILHNHRVCYLEYLKPHKQGDVTFMRLPNKYFMHDTDFEVISFTENDKTYEVHMDKNESINKIYEIL